MTENVKIYTIEELKNMGWEFLSTNTLVQTHFDDEFVELLYSEKIPDNFPAVVSFKQFQPYFTGPMNVPSLSYNNFSNQTLLFDVEKEPSIPGKYMINSKMGLFIITGLSCSETMSLLLTLSVSVKGDTPLPFKVNYRRSNTEAWVERYSGLAYKMTGDTLPTLQIPILLSGLHPGSPFHLSIERDVYKFPIVEDKNLYIHYFALQGDFVANSITTAKKTFTDPKTGAVRSYSNTPVMCISEAESLQSAAEYASLIEYGEQVIVAAEPGKMYFPEEELYQWISPQQLDQFKKMYPDCVEISYNSALGYVYSQIGELYDIASILAGDTNDGTAKIMRWILTVLTAYNITSPSARHSETLRDNYEMVVKKVTEMKNGATTLHDAPIKETPNAWGTVVNGSKNKMRG